MHHKNQRSEKTPQVTTVVIKLNLILNYLYKYIYNRGEGNSLLLLINNLTEEVKRDRIADWLNECHEVR